MKRRSTLIASGLGAIAVLGLVAIMWPHGPYRHGDGNGPLGSYGIPGSEAMKVRPIATSWTYGVRLCLQPGYDAPILESARPVKAVGTGVRLLGTGVRLFQPTLDHQPIISVDGWPPPASEVPDPISDVRGFVVQTPCAGGAYDPTTELLVGLGLVSTDGGGWQGIEISYSSGGREYVLDLDHDLMICGASVDCTVPQSPGP